MKNRDAFTLMELLVSIIILSILMLFLYKSYASLNSSNSFYKNELGSIQTHQAKKRVIFLDISLALHGKTKITNQDSKEDVFFTQSSNSVHKNYNPYIAYTVKDSKLYRLESFNEFAEYPLAAESEFSVECLGEVNSFRVYKAAKKRETYLVHIDFKEEDDIMFKISVLNES